MGNYDDERSFGRIDPYEDAIAPSLSDTVAQTQGCSRGIRCITAGTITVLTAANTTRTITLFTPGEVYRIGIRRVNATGATGTYELLY